MAELGQSSDPRALIPGDPASIYQTEIELRSYGDLMHSAGAGLARIDTSQGWRGDAATAFRAVYHGQPTKWTQAGDAFREAADALDDYARTMIWAQREAANAIAQWNAGNKQAASTLLANGRNQLASAGSAAAARVGRARDLAPPAPGLWSRLTSDVGSFLSGAGHVAEQAGEGILNVLASVGNAALHDPGALTELAGGIALATLSAGGEVAGVALDLTVVGSALGVPLNVVSAAGITAGLGIAAVGMGSIAKDAAGPDRVDMTSSQSSAGGGGSGGSGPGDGASNRIRPPQDGDSNYVVHNPADPSDTITDIDRVDGGTLWEEKTATGQHPGMNIQNWVQKNVHGKLDSYVRARQYLPGYENAPLGLDFTQSGATPQFKAAVEQAVDQWKASNPGVDVAVRWAP
jgi:uncharacterized protein YukE